MGDGQQEITHGYKSFLILLRVSWDNYVTVSNADAKDRMSNEMLLMVVLTEVMQLTTDGIKLENVPVIVQPGQAVGTVGLALGYGRKAALKEEIRIGLMLTLYIKVLMMFNL
jgi:molybdopterin-containing oxidoreductase family iron-sulfur binding subunit